MKKTVITIASNYADIIFGTSEDGTPLPVRFDLVMALMTDALKEGVEIVSYVVTPVDQIVNVTDNDGNDACLLAVFQVLNTAGDPAEVTFAM